MTSLAQPMAHARAGHCVLLQTVNHLGTKKVAWNLFRDSRIPFLGRCHDEGVAAQTCSESGHPPSIRNEWHWWLMVMAIDEAPWSNSGHLVLLILACVWNLCVTENFICLVARLTSWVNNEWLVVICYASAEAWGHQVVTKAKCLYPFNWWQGKLSPWPVTRSC